MLNFRKKSRKMGRTLQKQDRGAKPREQSTAFQGAKISHDAFQGANSLVQRVGILHTAIQGAKLISRCENHCPKCEFPKCNFRTPLFKVRKFLHRAKQGAKLSANLISRCENHCPKGTIFAHSNPRCEISSPRCANFAR